MKMNLNIKSRLTLWYLLIITLILVILSIVTYFLLSRSLYDIARKPSDLTIISLNSADTDTGLQQPSLLTSYTISEEWLETLQSKPSDTLSIYTPQGQIEVDQKNYITAEMKGEQQVQLFLVSSPDHPTVSEVAAIVQPVSKVSDTLAAYRRVLIYVIPIAALLAVIPGFFLVRRMLKPVNTITKTALEIGQKGLSDRIEVTNQDELGRLAETLNRTFDSLQDSVKRERQFTADVSHEIRTPLSIMRGETSLALSKERSADDYHQSLKVIAVEINHLLSTINGLLELTRTDNGIETIKKNRVNLAELLTDMSSDMETLCEEKSIKFKFNLINSLTIEGDEVKLRELFLNLIDNAVRYTSPEGNITVSLTQFGNEACIVISDSGIGIAPEHLPHIFERFYRADKTRTGNARGAGLGLAICKSIAELHGGKISAESIVGSGSTFTVLLPLS